MATDTAPPPGTGLHESALEAVAWPLARGGEALEALARAARLPLPHPPPVLPRAQSLESSRLGAWLDMVARAHGLEVELLYTRHGEVAEALGRAGPALVEVVGPHGVHALVALLHVSASGRTAWVLAPDETRRKVELQTLTLAVQALVEKQQGPVTERVLERAGLRGAQRAMARRALLGVQLANTHLVAARALRLPPGARLVNHLRAQRAGWRLVLLVLLAMAIQACVLCGWWLIGRGAFEGQLDEGWLWAWALMGLTAVPLQAALTWTQGALALDLSILLRRRLLTGALALPMDEARRGGIGEYVGKTFESAGMEQMALAGGFISLLAVIDVALAASLVVAGPAGAYGLAALGGFAGLLAVLVARQSWLFRGWTNARIAMTHALIERMLGHRTRLVQEPPERWHEEEDSELAHYTEISRRWDEASARVATLARRGLLPVVLLVTLPGVLAGASMGETAVGVGAALLAARALGALTVGVQAVAGAQVLFRSVRPILEAARLAPAVAAVAGEGDGKEQRPGGLFLLPQDAPPPPSQALLEVKDLGFRHEGAPRPVLEGASLTIRAGERVLLEGSSGSGKSTLASILTGLRTQNSGVVLLGGMDMATWKADGWGSQIAGAPQFHENHVVAGTLAMNLLLGRDWPHSTEDLNQARALCEELGLGELLARMPSGLMQMVGERGWQLSHGEQSRIFVARALLQRARVVVLDEAFGALDPMTLRKVMACIEARASTLIVIAHP